MDVVLGPGNGGQEGREELVARGVDLYLVVLERQRQVLVGKEVHEGAVAVGYVQVFLFHKLEHGAFRQLVQASLADHPVAPCVLAKEEIEHEAYKRQEHEHKNPCHRLCRLLVVHENGNDGHYDQKDVDERYGPVNVEHRLI